MLLFFALFSRLCPTRGILGKPLRIYSLQTSMNSLLEGQQCESLAIIMWEAEWERECAERRTVTFCQRHIMRASPTCQHPDWGNHAQRAPAKKKKRPFHLLKAQNKLLTHALSSVWIVRCLISLDEMHFLRKISKELEIELSKQQGVSLLRHVQSLSVLLHIHS